MTSFRELMERESFTDIEFIAKPRSDLYLALGWTGDEITRTTFDNSLEVAVKHLLDARTIPGVKSVQNWLRFDPGRIFAITRNYDGIKQFIAIDHIRVSLTSEEGELAYRQAVHIAEDFLRHGM